MSARVKIEISAKDVEKKEMLEGISDLIEEPCQETNSVQISYSEEDDGDEIIRKVSANVSAKYINWKEIIEKISEIDDAVWQEISSLDLSYTESEEE